MIETDAFIYGKGYYGIGNYEESLKYFGKALTEILANKDAPSKAEEYNEYIANIYYYIGKSYLKLGKYTETIITFTKKLSRKPDCADSLDSLGFAYLNKSEYVKAEESFIKALKIDENYVSALHNLGVLYFNQEKYNESFSLLYKAYEFEKQNPYILHSYANLLDKVGKSLESLKYYEESLKYIANNNINVQNSIKHDYAEALNNVAGDFYQEGQFIKAQEYYLKALDQNNENIITINQLGMCASELGNYERAINYFNQLITINKGSDADDWINLAFCLEKQNNLDSAQKAINKALELAPNDDIAKEINESIKNKIAINDSFKWQKFVNSQEEGQSKTR